MSGVAVLFFYLVIVTCSIFLTERSMEQQLKTKAEIDIARMGYARRCNGGSSFSSSFCNEAAAVAFPYPKIERPREVKAGARVYRIRNGKVESKGSTPYFVLSAYSIEDLRALGQLADSPTECVEVNAAPRC